MRTHISSRGSIALLALGLLAGPAAAHHPMGGETPQTLLHGLLSGLGHPVIGPDHLAFIVAIGIAAALVPAGIGLISAFVAASTAGVLVHLGAVNVPASETLVAGSVIAAGALVAMGRGPGSGLWLGLAVLAGLLHGYVFGEAVVGAEQSVVGAYLVGLAMVASGIAVALMAVTRTMVERAVLSPAHLRTAGVMLGCVGVVMLAGSLVVLPA